MKEHSVTKSDLWGLYLLGVVNKKVSILKILIFFAILVCFVATTDAQVSKKGPFVSEGKDFYVGLPLPSSVKDSSATASYAPKLFISSYSDSNLVTVSYFNAKTGIEVKDQTYLIKGKRTIEVSLNKDKMLLTGDGESAEWKSAHLTSKSPVSVQFFSSGVGCSGSYTPLPVSIVGKEYVIESYNDNPGNGITIKDTTSGYFMIIAAFDGTTIQIISNSTTKVLHHPGVMCGEGATGAIQDFTISLQRGQCYLVKSSGIESACDISGSTVICDKPITILAGHENGTVSGGWVDTANITDGRDFMIEQMIPVEYWDTIDYVSIPFMDATNGQTGGEGDEYRLWYGKLTNSFPGYPSGAAIVMNPGNTTIQSGSYDNPTRSIVAKTPANFYSTNGTKFHVAQYDRRMQGTETNPAPSQMGLLPMTLWRSAYLWHVPNIQETVKQDSYINLICRREDYLFDSLLVSDNGGLPTPIHKAGFQALKIYDTIPDHPNLLGITMLVPPGDYYIINTATTKKPFVVYSYGRGLINSGTNQNSFSYASVAGFIVGPVPDDSMIYKITVDTLCDGWTICCKISGGAKIKSITLLNDQDEDIVDKPNSSKGYVYYNTRFNPVDDPDGKGEINLEGTDSSRCVHIFIPYQKDSAYAPVLFVDDQGNYQVVELYYSPHKLGQRMAGDNIISSIDSLRYPTITLGDSAVATINFYNDGSLSTSSPDIILTDLYFEGASNVFEATKIIPALPSKLKPKATLTSSTDTLSIEVRFKPTDTLRHTQKMVISGLCFGDTVILTGKAKASIASVNTPPSNNLIKVHIKDRLLIAELPTVAPTALDCFLYDLLGRKVMEWPKQESTTSLLTLPLSSISSGPYLLKIGSYSALVFIDQ